MADMEPAKRAKSTIASRTPKLLLRVVWFPVLVVLSHLILSNVFDAYRHYPHFNMLIHFAGGIAIAYFFDGALRVFQSAGSVGELDAFLRFTLLFSLTATTAVFWEFAEFISDLTLGTQSQLGLKDTLLDMALGIMGGLVLLAVRVGKWGRF
ncbi:hypothetical protein IIA15_11170 [candidate division TA06 bacterium]|nr:hypothetical protein [candidate division TA06 bacterium]